MSEKERCSRESGPGVAKSRRDFLKQSAACAGAVVSFGVVGIILPDDVLGDETVDYDWNKHRWVYLVDTTKCIGCGACVRACRAENDVPEGMYRTWIERYEIPVEGEAHVDSPNGGELGFHAVTSGMEVRKAFFVPKLCNHCEATPCTQVCPVGASYTTRDGAVLVDDKRCIGCGYCIQACPYGSRYLNPTTRTAAKCTWCYHRITKGLKPACVEVCPVGARMFGDRKNPDDPVNEMLATRRVQVLQPELLTKPQCFYLGLDMEVR
ncbi:MAG: 4Fe-4S dicluster domain-containing protein [Candidatus Krumholzibacteria bacterium]|nr:4Fe-4S dicluster domain-containing protein [Candidatus Krumholzibacteria bacterium]